MNNYLNSYGWSGTLGKEQLNRVVNGAKITETRLPSYDLFEYQVGLDPRRSELLTLLRAGGRFTMKWTREAVARLLNASTGRGLS